ncbi:hypothetical protein ATANTOWER_019709 [Ataeniobius toweri]|uniref:Uncharacterized protein n=1 Tax=Ataeniobius toweri TaxID=208326 RepID=A0ABU7AI22_9TELE|nr:hypothetical protein [Ataeniobius toweri]
MIEFVTNHTSFCVHNTNPTRTATCFPTIKPRNSSDPRAALGQAMGENKDLTIPREQNRLQPPTGCMEKPWIQK